MQGTDRAVRPGQRQPQAVGYVHGENRRAARPTATATTGHPADATGARHSRGTLPCRVRTNSSLTSTYLPKLTNTMKGGTMRYPTLNFALGETIDMLRDSVYQFAQAELAPR